LTGFPLYNFIALVHILRTATSPVSFVCHFHLTLFHFIHSHQLKSFPHKSTCLNSSGLFDNGHSQPPCPLSGERSPSNQRPPQIYPLQRLPRRPNSQTPNRNDVNQRLDAEGATPLMVAVCWAGSRSRDCFCDMARRLAFPG